MGKASTMSYILLIIMTLIQRFIGKGNCMRKTSITLNVIRYIVIIFMVFSDIAIFMDYQYFTEVETGN